MAQILLKISELRDNVPNIIPLSPFSPPKKKFDRVYKIKIHLNFFFF
jgi:hypothetical protein